MAYDNPLYTVGYLLATSSAMPFQWVGPMFSSVLAEEYVSVNLCN